MQYVQKLMAQPQRGGETQCKSVDQQGFVLNLDAELDHG